MAGAKFIFVPDDKDDYMFPSWYPRREFQVGKVERNVLVFNIKDKETLDKLVAEFDARGFLVKASYERKTKVWTSLVSEPPHSNMLVGDESRACDVGAREAIPRGMSGPRGIVPGGSRSSSDIPRHDSRAHPRRRRSVSLSVPPERRSSMNAYRRFFSQYGSLRPESRWASLMSDLWYDADVYK